MPNYLYNGVELPALPEWDKKTYPYATMRYKQSDSVIVLYLSTTPFVIEVKGNGWSVDYYFYGVGAGSSIAYICSIVDGDTGFIRKENMDDSYDDEGRANDSFLVYNMWAPKWANYDILNTDGSVYLPASYPIDAETGEEIHDYEVGNNEPEEPETPDPVPVSPYLPINGAWVKHDIYKQVGNSWVKQPQGAVEVEGGAWSALS